MALGALGVDQYQLISFDLKSRVCIYYYCNSNTATKCVYFKPMSTQSEVETELKRETIDIEEAMFLLFTRVNCRVKPSDVKC